MGYFSKKFGKYDEALEHYYKAKEYGRDDEWINSEIAECLGETGKEEEAISIMQGVLSNKNCDKISVNSQIGYLYGKLFNPKEALEYLYEAEKLGRNDIWLYSEIGWNLAESSENYERALEYLNKAKDLGRDDVWLWEELGFVLSKLNKKKEAIKYFEKARFVNSENDWTAYHLGKLYRKAGEIEKAINLQESFLERTHFKGWVELELAWCYALIDEKEKASEYLKEADSYIGGEIANSSELKKEFDQIKQLLSTAAYLS